jgi:phage protein D
MPVAKHDQPLVPSVEMKVNGFFLPAEAMAYVIGVTVDDSVELPGMFTIELAGGGTLKQTIPWVDDQRFEVGGAVEIKMGYGSEMETLFSGEITGLEPEFVFDRPPGLIVHGYDRRHRLRRGRKTRTFVQQKDSEIASRIAGEAGLTAEVVDSRVTHDYVLQANLTDLEFLRQRARRIEYEVVVIDKRLLFRPIANAESAVLTLVMEKELLEFYPRLTSMRQVSEVAIRSWNAKEKKEIVGRARTGDEISMMGGQRSGGRIAHAAFGAAAELIGVQPVMTQAEADQLARARLNHRALGLIEGQGVCYGRTDLRAGKVIRVEGVGRRFSGLYYVTGAIHRYTQQRGYQTHFAVRRNAS